MNREELRLKAEKAYIETAQIKILSELVHKNRIRSKGKSEPKCLLIIGDSGAGKTTFIKYYMQKFNNPITIDHDHETPVLITSLHAKSTRKQALRQMLFDLNDPNYERIVKNTDSLLNQFIILLKARKTGLIIIDEFQSLINTVNNNVLSDTADMIKTIIVETKIPIVLLGMPWSLKILSASAGAQLDRRFKSYKELAPFKIIDKDERLYYLKFLAMLEKQLDFPFPVKLTTKGIALRLFSASRGNIGFIVNLVRDAIEICLDEDVPDDELELKMKHFIQAWDDIVDTSIDNGPKSTQLFKWNYRQTIPHPFKKPLEKLDLHEIKENSSWNENAKRGESRILEATIRKIDGNDITFSDLNL